MDRVWGRACLCVVQLRERECSTGVSGISISTVAAGLLLAVCLKCSLTFHCLNTDLLSSPFINLCRFGLKLLFFHKFTNSTLYERKIENEGKRNIPL